MARAPRIKTTVVGSYPVPDWLAAAPSEQALVDATRVILHTQEHAGIDVVCDGELYRFDTNHPETNGMIEYFVHPLDGVRTRMSFDELAAFRTQHAVRFRMRPPGVVESAIGRETTPWMTSNLHTVGPPPSIGVRRTSVAIWPEPSEHGWRHSSRRWRTVM